MMGTKPQEEVLLDCMAFCCNRCCSQNVLPDVIDVLVENFHLVAGAVFPAEDVGKGL